ncbi:hypothetical protein [Kribbella sp. NPDC048928]|uniref:hypothetical protein n=1 Tax=Kribbella sp. NPDC048928 TaxID=3364111 RepID=UPI0037170440
MLSSSGPDAARSRPGGTAGCSRRATPDNLGTAHPDGSLALSVEQVLSRLQQAQDADRPLSEDEVWLLRDAMNTVAHEATHLMTPLGDKTAPEAYPYDDAASAFDEGRTEYWADANLDDIVEDVFPEVGLGHRKDAVVGESSLSAYPGYSAAVRHLDEELAARSGLTREEVTQRLVVADDPQRWNVAVDMVIDEQLARKGLMPETDRADVRRQLVAPLRESFGRLAAVEADESLADNEKAAAGIKAAQEPVAGLDTELDRIRTQQELSPDLKRLQALTAPQAPAAGAIGPRGEGGLRERAGGSGEPSSRPLRGGAQRSGLRVPAPGGVGPRGEG